MHVSRADWYVYPSLVQIADSFVQLGESMKVRVQQRKYFFKVTLLLDQLRRHRWLGGDLQEYSERSRTTSNPYHTEAVELVSRAERCLV